jgi:hypothetical protein
MPMFTRTPIIIIAIVALFSAGAGLMSNGALAQDATPVASPSPTVPPTITPLTGDDAALVAAWGQWELSFPTAISPAADTTGGACGLGQQGQTFFLAPSAAGAGSVNRACTIVEGTSVLVPVIAVDCSTAEADPFHGTDAASLASCAKTNGDAITSGHVTVDGTDVPAISTYRVQSPVFSVVLPESNILNATAGPASVVVDGAFITVDGLTAGSHTISYGGTYQAGGALDITYTLTVVAAPVASS